MALLIKAAGFAAGKSNHENSKDNQKILPLLQKTNRAKNKTSRNGFPKRNFDERFKIQGEAEGKGQGNRKQGKMGFQTRNVKIQEKIQNNKKDKHNVHMQNMRKIQISKKRAKGGQTNTRIKWRRQKEKKDFLMLKFR